MRSAGCGAPHEDGHDDTCITCGDSAAWVRVLEVDPRTETARCVDAQGRSDTVATELVGAVSRDDALLVHAGTAIHREAGAEAPPAPGDG